MSGLGKLISLEYVASLLSHIASNFDLVVQPCFDGCFTFYLLSPPSDYRRGFLNSSAVKRFTDLKIVHIGKICNDTP